MPCAFQLDDPRRRSPGCQFSVPEEELIIADTSTEMGLCQFHLPVGLKAEWDRARIDVFNMQIFDYIDRAKETSGIADLSGVEFPGTITFERYAGEGNGLPELMFFKTAFGCNALFKGVVFERDVNFKEVTFSGTADFERATFGDAVGFRAVKFDRPCSFERAIFSLEASFIEVTFQEHAQFVGARFNLTAYFEGVIFRSTASFHSASFRETAYFGETRFLRGVLFIRATFTDDANFFATTFERSAEFIRVGFGGNASFLGKSKREESAGAADIFGGFVSFRGARFAKRAEFNNRRFLGGADFREATFGLAPEFHNAVLHQDTRFCGTLFLDRKGTDDVDAASAYRTLKLAMESVRARDEEAMFYAYEQESLRAKRETPWSVRLFSLLYEQTADYGRSFMRPLAWLVLGFFLFLLSYALVGGHDLWGDGESVLRFALQQVFQPFWAFRSGADVPGPGQPVPVWLALMAALQSVLTLTFLTLFLLALRRRFRLD